MKKNTLVSFFCFALLLFAKDVKAQRTIHLQDVDEGKALAELVLEVSNESGVILNQYISNAEGNVIITEQGEVALYAYGSGYDADIDTLFPHQKKKIYLIKKLNISINPIVVTGEYGKTKQSNSVNNIRVIDVKKAIKAGAQNLGQLLQNEVNISMQQDNVLGSSIIMQGVSGQNIKILIDGVPMIGRLNGSIDISQINLNNVKRIEIIEGPMSVIYGTDALGGVINVITKKHTNKKYSGGFSVYKDQLNNTNFDVFYQKKLSKHWNSYASFGRQFFDGVDLDKTDRSFDWKPKIKLASSLALNYHGKKWNHNIDSRFFQEHLLDRSNTIDKVFVLEGLNSNYRTIRFNQAIFSDYVISRSKKLKFINAFNFYKRSKEVDLRNLSTGSEERYGQNEEDLFNLFMLRGIYTNRVRGDFAYQIGYDANLNSGKGNKLTSMEKLNQTDIALFTSLKFTPHKKLIIQPAARLIYNSKFGTPLKESGFLSKVKIAPIIPSIHIKYQISENLVSRFSYGKGFRAPTLKEMHLNFVDINHNVLGNSNLLAESSSNFNGSFSFTKKINKSWWLGIKNSIFYNDLQNKINLALIDEAQQLYTYVNVGKFKSQGLGFDILGSYKAFKAEVGISLISTNDEMKYNNQVSHRFLFYNQARLNINYRHKKSNITSSIFLKRTGRTTGYNEKLEIYEVQPYSLLDFTMSKNILKYRMNITVGCKNILNITNIQNIALGGNQHNSGNSNLSVSPGRGCFVSLMYSFGKNEK